MPYVEHWPTRIGYLFALVGAVQFFTWSTKSTELSLALMLLAVWILYAVPSILVESSLGWNLGPPDSYFGALPLLRGCIVPLMLSLFLAIPMYSVNSAYAMLDGYHLLANLSSNNIANVRDLDRILTNENASTMSAWEVPKLLPDDITVAGGIVVILLWILIGVGCSLGPISLAWMMAFLGGCCGVMLIVLLSYLVNLAPNNLLASQFELNVNVSVWKSYETWKWCLSYVNRQTMIGYGIYGTFAAYSATMGRGGKQSGARKTAICQTIFLSGYPFVWLVMTITKDAVQMTLTDPASNLTSQDTIKLGRWIASFRILQSLCSVATTMCIFEVWCNTWVRCMRGAFPFRFHRFYVYRPVASLLNVLIFGGLSVISLTKEGRNLYKQFHGLCVPFILVELGQICIFAGMQYSQIWDNLSRGKRRRSAKSMLCGRLLKTIGTTIITSLLIIACIWRGAIFIEQEILPETTYLGWKIAILAVPWVVAIIVSVSLAIKDKGTGCKRLCCPTVIPNRAARGAGFYPGIVNNNANEHYWPDEFEVLPFDEQ